MSKKQEKLSIQKYYRRYKNDTLKFILIHIHDKWFWEFEDHIYSKGYMNDSWKCPDAYNSAEEALLAAKEYASDYSDFFREELTEEKYFEYVKMYGPVMTDDLGTLAHQEYLIKERYNAYTVENEYTILEDGEC
jgi:hypothetical protein